jgi:hypothetical protein
MKRQRIRDRGDCCGMVYPDPKMGEELPPLTETLSPQLLRIIQDRLLSHREREKRNSQAKKAWECLAYTRLERGSRDFANC